MALPRTVGGGDIVVLGTAPKYWRDLDPRKLGVGGGAKPNAYTLTTGMISA